jgi:beta-galactosidase
VRPQESGHHTGVEWLKIGPVRISAPQDFEFNALRCSIEDLDPREADGSRIWGHVNEVPLRPYVELCLDGFMTGVGGYNSWGSKPEPDRSVWADRDYSFSLIFFIDAAYPPPGAIRILRLSSLLITLVSI